MFNPADLPVTYGEWAFVGVRRNNIGKMEFCVPLGFEDFPNEDSNAVNRLFFDLYKVFRRFADEIRRASNSQIQNSRGGNTFQQDSVSFIDKEDELITLYSKIPMLEDVLESYDDLRVFLLTGHDAKTNQINYARIDQYLHKAVYLEDSTAYIDVMVLPKPVIHYDISDLVRMYCFIFLEIKRALEEQSTLPGEVEAQAEIFKGQHLRGDSGLFVESHNDTISLLKETLAEIERQVTWKDNDYWYFFRVIERFLYGELTEDREGEGWGISKFSAVWEALCIEWLFHRFDKERRKYILFADTAKHANTTVGVFPVYISTSFTNPFYIEYKGRKRYIRPDFVRMVDAIKPSDVAEDIFNQTFKVTKLARSATRNYDAREVRLLKRDSKSRQMLNDLGKIIIRSREFRVSRGGRTSYDPDAPVFSDNRRVFDEAIAEFKRTKLLNGLYSVQNKNSSIMIVDFKYVTRDLYTDAELGRKATADVKKQGAYEVALLLNGFSESVSSQFCIPKFYAGSSGDIGSTIEEAKLNPTLQRKGIEVLEVNFDEVKNLYLKVEPL